MVLECRASSGASAATGRNVPGCGNETARRCELEVDGPFIVRAGQGRRGRHRWRVGSVLGSGWTLNGAS